MSSDLTHLAERIRTAVQSGDFIAGRAALSEFATALERAWKSAGSAPQRAELEKEWESLVVWIRSMAATSHELARSQWELLQTAGRYQVPKPARAPSILNARG